MISCLVASAKISTSSDCKLVSGTDLQALKSHRILLPHNAEGGLIQVCWTGTAFLTFSGNRSVQNRTELVRAIQGLSFVAQTCDYPILIARSAKRERSINFQKRQYISFQKPPLRNIVCITVRMHANRLFISMVFR